MKQRMGMEKQKEKGKWGGKGKYKASSIRSFDSILCLGLLLGGNGQPTCLPVLTTGMVDGA